MADDAGLRGRDLIGLGGLLVGAVVAGTVLGILLDRRPAPARCSPIAGVFLGMVRRGARLLGCGSARLSAERTSGSRR